MMKKNNKYQVLGNYACIFDTERNCLIPLDPANTDYQAYLEWLEAGNEPEVVE
jgi:hypothetical protein